MTPDHFLGFLHGLAEMIDTAPTPAQWALVKAKLAMVGQSPAPDWYAPPFHAPRFLGDELPCLLPWQPPPYVSGRTQDYVPPLGTVISAN